MWWGIQPGGAHLVERRWLRVGWWISLLEVIREEVSEFLRLYVVVSRYPLSLVE
jgi:hypothetical protein